jgi:hypothetical protein
MPILRIKIIYNNYYHTSYIYLALKDMCYSMHMNHFEIPHLCNLFYLCAVGYNLIKLAS